MRTLVLTLLLAACGGGDDGKTVTIDSPTSSGTALTVKNYLNWCSVSVNGGAASTAASQMVNVNPGAITLTGTQANASFKIDTMMWHHTDGDTGNGEAGTVSGTTSTATVTVGSTAKCVWVCCPFTNGSGCPTTDQC